MDRWMKGHRRCERYGADKCNQGTYIAPSKWRRIAIGTLVEYFVISGVEAVAAGFEEEGVRRIFINSHRSQVLT